MTTALRWSNVTQVKSYTSCNVLSGNFLSRNFVSRKMFLFELFVHYFGCFSPSSLGVLGKRPKFRPFSYNMLLLFENSQNFGRFPTTLNVSAVFQQLCFGRFPTTVFGRFPTTVFGRFPTNFRPFYCSACHVT